MWALNIQTMFGIVFLDLEVNSNNFSFMFLFDQSLNEIKTWTILADTIYKINEFQNPMSSFHYDLKSRFEQGNLEYSSIVENTVLDDICS